MSSLYTASVNISFVYFEKWGSVSTDAQSVYFELYAQQGKKDYATISRNRLARSSGRSALSEGAARKKVTRCLKELEEAGRIKVQRRNGCVLRCHVVRIANWPEHAGEVESEPGSKTTPVTKNQGRKRPPPGSKTTPVPGSKTTPIVLRSTEQLRAHEELVENDPDGEEANDRDHDPDTPLTDEELARIKEQARAAIAAGARQADEAAARYRPRDEKNIAAKRSPGGEGTGFAEAGGVVVSIFPAERRNTASSLPMTGQGAGGEADAH